MEHNKVFIVFIVGLFGALGCSLRYLISSMLNNFLGKGFPYGTLTVNIIGSLLIGILVELATRGTISPIMRVALVSGLLGGLTTYSSFSYETIELVINGELATALLNVVLTLFVCGVFTWIGIIISKQI